MPVFLITKHFQAESHALSSDVYSSGRMPPQILSFLTYLTGSRGEESATSQWCIGDTRLGTEFGMVDACGICHANVIMIAQAFQLEDFQ